MTTIIGNRVALGKRLAPLNGENTAVSDDRKQMEQTKIHVGQRQKIGLNKR